MSDWLYYFFCIPVAATTWLLAKKLRFEGKTIALLLSALLLYYFSFYHSTVYDFSVDAPFHVDYINYLAEDFFHNSIIVITSASAELPKPSLYPLPFYYIAATGFYKLGEYSGMSDPLAMARHFTMILYLGFIFFSILTLRMVVARSSAAYHPTLAVLLFWPVGVVMGGFIHPDIAAYCVEMAMMYTLVRWLKNPPPTLLANAFFLGGLALLVKSTGLLYIAMTALCLLYSIVQNRRRIRTAINARLLLSIAVVGTCYFVAAAHHPLNAVTQTHEAPLDFWGHIKMLTYFNPATFVWDTMINPYDDNTGYFWHFFLRTLVMGEKFIWKPLVLLFVIGVVFLAQLLYTVVGFIRRGSITVEEKHQIYFFAVLVCILIGAEFFMRLHRPAEVDMSHARYVFPIMTMFVMAYGKAMEWHERAGRDTMVRVGRTLASGWFFLVVALFLAQHIFLSTSGNASNSLLPSLGTSHDQTTRSHFR